VLRCSTSFGSYCYWPAPTQARHSQNCNWKRPFPLSRSMTMAERADLESIHARAICDEIGSRLSCVLRPDHEDLPSRLRALLDRLKQIEGGAPILLPSIEGMARPLMDAA
jgi:hypothetical protein